MKFKLCSKNNYKVWQFSWLCEFSGKNWRHFSSEINIFHYLWYTGINTLSCILSHNIPIPWLLQYDRQWKDCGIKKQILSLCGFDIMFHNSAQIFYCCYLLISFGHFISLFNISLNLQLVIVFNGDWFHLLLNDLFVFAITHLNLFCKPTHLAVLLSS